MLKVGQDKGKLNKIKITLKSNQGSRKTNRNEANKQINEHLKKKVGITETFHSLTFFFTITYCFHVLKFIHFFCFLFVNF